MEKRLTATTVRKAGDGKLFDGGGLALVKKGTSGKWVYRYSHLGKRREMGLGSWPALSLADARKQRDTWAAELAAGRDPIAVRDARREAEMQERDRHDPTFAEMVDIVFEAKKATLRGGGTRGRWRSPLDLHVIPRFGRKRMSQIVSTDIKDALAPIWRTKYPTAEKAIGRTRKVFNEAKHMGFDCDPFTVDAAKRMLGDVIHKPTPIASTPWQDIPAVYDKLNSGNSGDLCLRFMMLTLVRLDAAAGAHQDEIERDIWTVPAERVKGYEGKVADFRCPLVPEAQEIAAEASRFSPGLLFPGDTRRPIGSRALELRLERKGEPGRPHGFRSSFRSWVQDTEACSWEVAETILGHQIGTKVERSYARSDLLERRRTVMEAWARFVTGQESNVVPLSGRA